MNKELEIERMHLLRDSVKKKIEILLRKGDPSTALSIPPHLLRKCGKRPCIPDILEEPPVIRDSQVTVSSSPKDKYYLVSLTAPIAENDGLFFVAQYELFLDYGRSYLPYNFTKSSADIFDGQMRRVKSTVFRAEAINPDSLSFFNNVLKYSRFKNLS